MQPGTIVSSEMAPLPPRRHFVRHMVRNAAMAAVALGAGLALGMAGYHWLDERSWPSSFLNASMILSGEGPMDRPQTPAGLTFAGMYAIFSGLLFPSAVAVVLAPALRRLLHRFHLELKSAGARP